MAGKWKQEPKPALVRLPVVELWPRPIYIPGTCYIKWERQQGARLLTTIENHRRATEYDLASGDLGRSIPGARGNFNQPTKLAQNTF